MRKLLLMLCALPLLWMAAFTLFVQTLPVKRAGMVRTDVIIVLTGGNGRVEQGLEALADGVAPVLFVSGVGRKVTLQELIAAHTSPQTQAAIARRHPHIILDYVASTTQSNASEAAAFVAKQNIRSVRLVTAHYHMPRSLTEFRAAMPGVAIVPDPVVPNNFHRNDWWRDDATRSLMIGEFHKYLAATVLRWLP